MFIYLFIFLNKIKEKFKKIRKIIFNTDKIKSNYKSLYLFINVCFQKKNMFFINLHYLVQKYTNFEALQQTLQSFSKHELFHPKIKTKYEILPLWQKFSACYKPESFLVFYQKLPSISIISVSTYHFNNWAIEFPHNSRYWFKFYRKCCVICFGFKFNVCKQIHMIDVHS